MRSATLITGDIGVVSVQIALVSSFTAAFLGVDAIGDGMALIVAGGTARLVYSEADLNAAMSLSLGSVPAPGSGYVSSQSLSAPIAIGNLDPGRSIAFQAAGSLVRAFLFDSHSGALTSSVLDSAGQPGAATTVSSNIGALKGIETFAVMGGATGDCAVLSKWNTAGLQVFHLNANGSLTLTDTVHDTVKSHVGNVSDTASVTVGGQNYLLSLSSLENGITSYTIDGNDKASLVDSLGTHDLLAVSGPAALQVMQVAGLTYAVIAATGSSSLSVVRVNDMGCLFQTDHVVDDLTTRFAHTAVLDSFTLNGRSFVVTAGTDAGITIMELLPGGKLSHFATGAFEVGLGLAAVTGLEVAVNGTTASIFVVDAHADLVQRFEVSLANLGGVIQAVGGSATGTSKDDLLLGSAATETLSGWGGDDMIFSGGGADVMTGGAGADRFVFAASSDNLRITDFELHSDRIDLSDWGHVYSKAALTITATATGAVISLNGHDVTLVAGQSLSAASFLDSDFLF